MSATMIWNFFNDVMQQAIEDYVPNISSVINKKKPLWMTGEVLRMVKRKHQLWKKKWRESRDDAKVLKYRKGQQSK